jgi:hypothetical protein
MTHDDDFWLAVFEVLIPADAASGMPSATMPALVPMVRARLEAAPGMTELVTAGLDVLAEQAPSAFAALDLADRTALVKAVDDAQPGGFGALAFNLYAVYYQQPEVLAALGLPDRAPFPEGFVMEGDDEAWFEKARARARRA